MEPYEDYVLDDLLRVEIRETVTAPPTTVVLPTAGWIGMPMQRTVKASGRLHFPTTDTTSPNLHEITRAAPDGSGPLPLRKEASYGREHDAEPSAGR